ncbi:MAG: hypothetical protein QOE61_4976 [Micromonosporaceae bacterium]|jgi:hypothetical protein|nr:hypothetical protein [Micromonosporaceae bacterium]
MSDAAPVRVNVSAALEGLAENPALPAEMVRRLFAYRRGFGHVAKRADLTADLIAEIMATDHHWLLHSLALNRHLPDDVRLRLAEHVDSSVRAALVIGGEHGGRELFDRLINDPDRRVREYLAQSEAVPADLRARLAHDPDPQIRATLACWWPEAPEAVRRILLTDPVGAVRAAACGTYYARLPHPVPPADLHIDLFDDPVTRAGVVRYLDLAADTSLRLATDPDDEVRQELAAHPQLPPDLRDQLAEDSSARVRVAIFARPDTPEPIRYRIYSDLQQDTGRLIDQMDGLDDESMLRKLEDHIAVIELRNLYLAWVSADPLPHIASPYVCFRYSAARSHSLPPEAVMRLLNDDESIVHTTMAHHAPHLVDLDAAERIDREFRPDKRTNWRPADDFTFPTQVLRRFATDPDPRMRCLGPRDPDLPPDLAEQLARDTDSSVRHAVAPHPNLPTPALTALLADPVDWVARAAATSPTLPVADMDRLLRLAGV